MTPHLFRYLNSSHVKDFFSYGSLRLGSFKKFQEHEDEQRLDKNEGVGMYVSKTLENGGQTTIFFTEHSKINAYILSTSMRYDEELEKKFSTDSYIRIANSTSFGMAIARQIPGVISCLEGPCIYQDKKIIEKEIGYIDVNEFKNPDGSINEKKATEHINSHVTYHPFFLKEKSFAMEVEYRFVWLVDHPNEEHLDIKVPEAIQFCKKPRNLTE